MRKAEDKEQARALVINRGLSIAAAARELNIPRKTVNDWAIAGNWIDTQNTLREEVAETNVKTATKKVKDESVTIQSTAERLLQKINIWLLATDKVLPKEASAIASALTSLAALSPTEGEKAVAGVIFLPNVNE